MSNVKTLNIWKTFFSEKGVSTKFTDVYTIYIEKLLDNNVPIIFDFTHLCLLLGRQNTYLASVVNSPDNHYRHFTIPKKSGGVREISTPFPALLEMQYWIFDNILKKIPINSSAHGFVYKKSILTNSKIHVGQKELLKLDLKNFFPSISLNRIIFVFKRLGYTSQVAFYLASICSFENHLPQGAPTSPYISNIIACKLDKRLIALAKKYGLRYTRYADDLTFSGNDIPVKFITYVNTIIQNEGFEMNTDKTRFYKDRGKRIVTGISVLENEIKLPREYKRNLRQELYYIFKFGLTSHVKKKKIKKATYLLSVIGKVNFWLSVEPKNSDALESKRKLSEIYKTFMDI